MGAFSIGGIMPLVPKYDLPDDDYGWCPPEVIAQGDGEDCYPQTTAGWGEDALVMVDAPRLRRFSRHWDMMGNSSYHVEEYNLETRTKTTYTVTPDVLIPRSDTECLVEEAIRLLPPHSRFADLCTGSGCVAISILCHRPDLTADAFDVSPAALCVARENARRNGVAERVRFLERDILQRFPEERYAAIVSNPPYIAKRVIPSLSPEVQREPHIALDGGEDGTVFYRAMLQNRLPHTPLLWEIGYDQEAVIRRLAEEYGLSLRILRDLGGNVRVAHLFDP